MTHIVDYKGYTITYENGLYRIANVLQDPYLTFNDAKNKIDELAGDSSIIDLKNLYADKKK